MVNFINLPGFHLKLAMVSFFVTINWQDLKKTLDTFPYLDDIISSSETEREHDKNVEEFLKMLKENRP